MTYSSSNAATCSLASSLTLWIGSNPATVSCNGTYSVTITSSTAQRQWTFTFTATNSAGQSTTSTRTLTEQAPAPQPVQTPGLLQTSNWSGYVLSSSSTFTEVSGQWRVPTLNCSATPNAGAAEWVGIGGFGTSGTLLQTGIATNCVNGVQSNNGWFEEVPSNPDHSYSFTGFPVSAGDSIKASVYQWPDGTRWETCVEDLTTGLSGLMVTGEGWGVSTGGCGSTFREQGSTASLSYSGAYSVEWIVEDYQQGGIGGAYAPFANYGSVAFSNLTTSLVGWQLSAAQGIQLAQNGVVLSTPSTLTAAGFSVSFTAQ